MTYPKNRTLCVILYASLFICYTDSNNSRDTEILRPTSYLLDQIVKAGTSKDNIRNITCILNNNHIFDLIHDTKCHGQGNDVTVTFYLLKNGVYTKTDAVIVDIQAFDDVIMKYDDWILIGDDNDMNDSEDDTFAELSDTDRFEEERVCNNDNQSTQVGVDDSCIKRGMYQSSESFDDNYNTIVSLDNLTDEDRSKNNSDKSNINYGTFEISNGKSKIYYINKTGKNKTDDGCIDNVFSKEDCKSDCNNMNDIKDSEVDVSNGTRCIKYSSNDCNNVVDTIDAEIFELKHDKIDYNMLINDPSLNQDKIFFTSDLETLNDGALNFEDTDYNNINSNIDKTCDITEKSGSLSDDVTSNSSVNNPNTVKIVIAHEEQPSVNLNPFFVNINSDYAENGIKGLDINTEDSVNNETEEDNNLKLDRNVDRMNITLDHNAISASRNINSYDQNQIDVVNNNNNKSFNEECATQKIHVIGTESQPNMIDITEGCTNNNLPNESPPFVVDTATNYIYQDDEVPTNISDIADTIDIRAFDNVHLIKDVNAISAIETDTKYDDYQTSGHIHSVKNDKDDPSIDVNDSKSKVDINKGNAILDTRLTNTREEIIQTDNKLQPDYTMYTDAYIDNAQQQNDLICYGNSKQGFDTINVKSDINIPNYISTKKDINNLQEFNIKNTADTGIEELCHNLITSDVEHRNILYVDDGIPTDSNSNNFQTIITIDTAGGKSKEDDGEVNFKQSSNMTEIPHDNINLNLLHEATNLNNNLFLTNSNINEIENDCKVDFDTKTKSPTIHDIEKGIKENNLKPFNFQTPFNIWCQRAKDVSKNLDTNEHNMNYSENRNVYPKYHAFDLQIPFMGTESNQGYKNANNNIKEDSNKIFKSDVNPSLKQNPLDTTSYHDTDPFECIFCRPVVSPQEPISSAVPNPAVIHNENRKNAQQQSFIHFKLSPYRLKPNCNPPALSSTNSGPTSNTGKLTSVESGQITIPKLGDQSLSKAADITFNNIKLNAIHSLNSIPPCHTCTKESNEIYSLLNTTTNSYKNQATALNMPKSNIITQTNFKSDEMLPPKNQPLQYEFQITYPPCIEKTPALNAGFSNTLNSKTVPLPTNALPVTSTKISGRIPAANFDTLMGLSKRGINNFATNTPSYFEIKVPNVTRFNEYKFIQPLNSERPPAANFDTLMELSNRGINNFAMNTPSYFEIKVPNVSKSNEYKFIQPLKESNYVNPEINQQFNTQTPSKDIHFNCHKSNAIYNANNQNTDQQSNLKAKNNCRGKDPILTLGTVSFPDHNQTLSCKTKANINQPNDVIEPLSLVNILDNKLPTVNTGGDSLTAMKKSPLLYEDKATYIPFLNSENLIKSNQCNAPFNVENKPILDIQSSNLNEEAINNSFINNQGWPKYFTQCKAPLKQNMTPKSSVQTLDIPIKVNILNNPELSSLIDPKYKKQQSDYVPPINNDLSVNNQKKPNIRHKADIYKPILDLPRAEENPIACTLKPPNFKCQNRIINSLIPKTEISSFETPKTPKFQSDNEAYVAPTNVADNKPNNFDIKVPNTLLESRVYNSFYPVTEIPITQNTIPDKYVTIPSKSLPNYQFNSMQECPKLFGRQTQTIAPKIPSLSSENLAKHETNEILEHSLIASTLIPKTLNILKGNSKNHKSVSSNAELTVHLFPQHFTNFVYTAKDSSGNPYSATNAYNNPTSSLYSVLNTDHPQYLPQLTVSPPGQSHVISPHSKLPMPNISYSTKPWKPKIDNIDSTNSAQASYIPKVFMQSSPKPKSSDILSGFSTMPVNTPPSSYFPSNPEAQSAINSDVMNSRSYYAKKITTDTASNHHSMLGTSTNSELYASNNTPSLVHYISLNIANTPKIDFSLIPTTPLSSIGPSDFVTKPSHQLSTVKNDGTATHSVYDTVSTQPSNIITKHHNHMKGMSETYTTSTNPDATPNGYKSFTETMTTDNYPEIFIPNTSCSYPSASVNVIMSNAAFSIPDSMQSFSINPSNRKYFKSVNNVDLTPRYNTDMTFDNNYNAPSTSDSNTIFSEYPTNTFTKPPNYLTEAPKYSSPTSNIPEFPKILSNAICQTSSPYIFNLKPTSFDNAEDFSQYYSMLNPTIKTSSTKLSNFNSPAFSIGPSQSPNKVSTPATATNIANTLTTSNTNIPSHSGTSPINLLPHHHCNPPQMNFDKTPFNLNSNNVHSFDSSPASPLTNNNRLQISSIFSNAQKPAVYNSISKSSTYSSAPSYIPKSPTKSNRLSVTNSNIQIPKMFSSNPIKPTCSTVPANIPQSSPNSNVSPNRSPFMSLNIPIPNMLCCNTDENTYSTALTIPQSSKNLNTLPNRSTITNNNIQIPKICSNHPIKPTCSTVSTEFPQSSLTSDALPNKSSVTYFNIPNTNILSSNTTYSPISTNVPQYPKKFNALPKTSSVMNFNTPNANILSSNPTKPKYFTISTNIHKSPQNSDSACYLKIPNRETTISNFKIFTDSSSFNDNLNPTLPLNPTTTNSRINTYSSGTINVPQIALPPSVSSTYTRPQIDARFFEPLQANALFSISPPTTVSFTGTSPTPSKDSFETPISSTSNYEPSSNQIVSIFRENLPQSQTDNNFAAGYKQIGSPCIGMPSLNTFSSNNYDTGKQLLPSDHLKTPTKNKIDCKSKQIFAVPSRQLPKTRTPTCNNINQISTPVIADCSLFPSTISNYGIIDKPVLFPPSELIYKTNITPSPCVTNSNQIVSVSSGSQLSIVKLQTPTTSNYIASSEITSPPNNQYLHTPCTTNKHAASVFASSTPNIELFQKPITTIDSIPKSNDIFSKPSIYVDNYKRIVSAPKRNFFQTPATDNRAASFKHVFSTPSGELNIPTTTSNDAASYKRIFSQPSDSIRTPSNIEKIFPKQSLNENSCHPNLYSNSILRINGTISNDITELSTGQMNYPNLGPNVLPQSLLSNDFTSELFPNNPTVSCSKIQNPFYLNSNPNTIPDSSFSNYLTNQVRYPNYLNTPENELKTDLRNYIKSLLNGKVYNQSELTLPLDNFIIFNSEPNISRINNPEFSLTMWDSNFKIVEAKISLKFKECSVNNFMPLISSSSKCNLEAVRDYAKSYVAKNYGEYILANVPYSANNEWVIINNNMCYNNCNILWPEYYY